MEEKEKISLNPGLGTIVQKSDSGVDFSRMCKSPQDILEISQQEIEKVFYELADQYDEIVVDMSGGGICWLTELMIERSNRIVYIADGSELGNKKLKRFCDMIRMLEGITDWEIQKKILLLYNRFIPGKSILIEEGVLVLGGIQQFEELTGKEVIREIAKIQVLDRI